jgi:hypothetical protein
MWQVSIYPMPVQMASNPERQTAKAVVLEDALVEARLRIDPTTIPRTRAEIRHLATTPKLPMTAGALPTPGSITLTAVADRTATLEVRKTTW